jgi:predicted secreted protein
LPASRGSGWDWEIELTSGLAVIDTAYVSDPNSWRGKPFPGFREWKIRVLPQGDTEALIAYYHQAGKAHGEWDYWVDVVVH